MNVRSFRRRETAAAKNERIDEEKRNIGIYIDKQQGRGQRTDRVDHCGSVVVQAARVVSV